jgi:hypothetical protein
MKFYVELTLNCFLRKLGILFTTSTISAPTTIKHGTKISVTGAQRTTPQDSEITAGLRKFA